MNYFYTGGYTVGIAGICDVSATLQKLIVDFY